MFYWFIVPAVLMVCVVLWLLIKPDMSTITGKITKTTTRQVTIPIAITVIVVGSILLWVWWDKLSSLALFTWWTLPLAIVFVYGGIAARKDEPVWSKRLFYIACALLLLIGSGHIIFGERFVRDPTAQTAHVVIEGQDPRGVPGDPLYMGHQLNSGRWVRSTNPLTGELFHPSECRPLTPTNVVTIEDGVKKVEVEMLPIPHKGFDYANKGLCRSPTDGTTRLVPWETKHSPIIPDLNPLSTPAELEADEAEKTKDVEQQKRILENKFEERMLHVKAHMKELEICDDLNMRQFLMKYIIPVLTEGMIDVWKVGPLDPVDYLAEYIFKRSNGA